MSNDRRLPDQPGCFGRTPSRRARSKPTPIVVRGIVYLGDLDGDFYAIDLATGKEKWKTKQEAGLQRRRRLARWPALRRRHRRRVSLPRCRQRRGEMAVTRPRREINSAPTSIRRMCCSARRTARCTASNAPSGEEAWKYQIEDQIRCSPTIVEGRAFLAGCDGKLHVIDLEKGEAIGTVPIESPTGCTPAVWATWSIFGTRGRHVLRRRLEEAGDRLAVSGPAAAAADSLLGRRHAGGGHLRRPRQARARLDPKDRRGAVEVSRRGG